MECNMNEIEQVILQLNCWQKQGYIRIIDYENISICLRKKLETLIEPEVDSWIKEWTDLWSGIYCGIKPYGYYVKQSPSSNKARMKEFLKENNFTKEEIFQATKNYLEDKRQCNWEFTKKSNKFINDTDGSTLYSYCDALKNSQQDTEKFYIM